MYIDIHEEVVCMGARLTTGSGSVAIVELLVPNPPTNTRTCRNRSTLYLLLIREGKEGGGRRE